MLSSPTLIQDGPPCCQVPTADAHACVPLQRITFALSTRDNWWCGAGNCWVLLVMISVGRGPVGRGAKWEQNEGAELRLKLLI
jgi:hypothetical protein